MSLDGLIKLLSQSEIKFSLNEPMSRHTTFKIGGNADVFASVCNIAQLKDLIGFCKKSEIPHFVLGNGSNILVSDKGIDGVVISLDGMNKVSANGNTLVCEAGATLRSVCLAAYNASLSGIEFAYGIPGTVGGALFMNAGAYGGEMSQIVISATAVDGNLNEVTLNLSDMLLGYRTSVFKNSDLIITGVKMQLKTCDKDEIKNKMDTFFASRREKQPLEYPSAGSTFKRPKGHFAGALIEKNNLKGLCVGGAQVSEKHAGFIINKKNATSEDVKSLIKKVQSAVKKSDGVELEPEVIFVGRE